jgi:hypothetical protein
VTVCDVVSALVDAEAIKESSDTLKVIDWQDFRYVLVGSYDDDGTVVGVDA